MLQSTLEPELGDAYVFAASFAVVKIVSK